MQCTLRQPSRRRSQREAAAERLPAEIVRTGGSVVPRTIASPSASPPADDAQPIGEPRGASTAMCASRFHDIGSRRNGTSSRSAIPIAWPAVPGRGSSNTQTGVAALTPES